MVMGIGHEDSFPVRAHPARMVHVSLLVSLGAKEVVKGAIEGEDLDPMVGSVSHEEPFAFLAEGQGGGIEELGREGALLASQAKDKAALYFEAENLMGISDRNVETAVMEKEAGGEEGVEVGGGKAVGEGGDLVVVACEGEWGEGERAALNGDPPG